MSEQTVNLNQAECLREISNVGSTVVKNLCSGESVIVPWGSVDWMAFVFLGLFVVTVTGLMARMVYAMMFEAY